MLRRVDLGPTQRWRPYSWSDAPFRARPWPELVERYLDLARLHLEHLGMVEIINSVIESGCAEQLAGNYTIEGLHIVDTERCAPPYSAISICSYGWSTPSPSDLTIQHVSNSGLREKISTDPDDAVPLFWRFVTEKYGISAATPTCPKTA